MGLSGKRLNILAAMVDSARAAIWRRLMRRTVFIAVTGSCGKTTATDALGAILSSRFPTNWMPGGYNGRRWLARHLLRTRPGHRFTVIEVGTKLPGALRRASWMIDPDVVVVLTVARVHSNTFADLDAIAAEKASLLGKLHGARLAILNADDARVLAMKERCRGRVLTFGRSPHCDLRVWEISARWPDRLSFVASTSSETCRVRTNFVGEHLLNSALGALLAAVALGMRLEDAASVLETVPPPASRMQAVELPNGVSFLRDEFNESWTTLQAALAVLADARAVRRVLVAGDAYDGPPDDGRRLEELGRGAASSSDLAVFTGGKMRAAEQAARAAGMAPHAVHAFRALPQAAEFLRRELCSGDLVLLRGAPQRHFERLWFAQQGSVRCWKKVCPVQDLCDSCPELGFARAPAESPTRISR